MGTDTKIEWTDHTLNPWIGCTKISPGCVNCYAKTRDDRNMLGPVRHWGPGAPRHITSKPTFDAPRKWMREAQFEGRRHRVFTASLADIFDAEAPVVRRRELWQTIRETSQWLDWQIVTKRPERIRDVMIEDMLPANFFENERCWLITSTENQKYADIRIPQVLQIPAAVHGISAEPLLGPIHIPGEFMLLLDWIIVGGESGHGARSCDQEWIWSLIQQCGATETACFVKQLGARHPAPGDIKGGDMLFWPEHLRVREFPEVGR